jgi:hypothetical protein
MVASMVEAPGETAFIRDFKRAMRRPIIGPSCMSASREPAGGIALRDAANRIRTATWSVHGHEPETHHRDATLIAGHA